MRRPLVIFSMLLVACGGDRFTEQPPAVADDAGANDAGSIDAGSSQDEHHGFANACETIGRTGESDMCRLFAYCGHRSFEVDCGARFTCICREPDVDGGATKEIVAAPVFCGSADTDLKTAFAAAHHACGW